MTFVMLFLHAMAAAWWWISHVPVTLPRVPEVSARIAADVAEVAYSRGLAGRPRPSDVLADVRASMYEPVYRPFV